jgi:hypothetical protein
MLEQMAATGGCQRAAEQARIAMPPIMPKILYLVTEEWFFVSHFLSMAQAVRDFGLLFAVATCVRAESSNALTFKNALSVARTLADLIIGRIANLLHRRR